MKQPDTILEIDTRIVTHAELGAYADLDRNPYRCPNKPGRIGNIVGGMGGDVYVVKHDDGTSAPYRFDEFELTLIGPKISIEVPAEPGIYKYGAPEDEPSVIQLNHDLRWRTLQGIELYSAPYFIELAKRNSWVFAKYIEPDWPLIKLELDGETWKPPNACDFDSWPVWEENTDECHKIWASAEILQEGSQNALWRPLYFGDMNELGIVNCSSMGEKDWERCQFMYRETAVSPWRAAVPTDTCTTVGQVRPCAFVSALDPEFMKDFVASAHEAAKKGAIGAFVVYFGDDTQAHTFGEIDERDLVHALERSKLEALSEKS